MILAVDHVGHNFGALWAVRDVTFDVAPSEIVGIIGPNGAGKSTLFNIIAGVLSPGAGSVRFFDHTISGQKPYQNARLGLARTFQIPKPFKQLTVQENVMLSALWRNRTPSRATIVAREVMAFMGLDPFADTTAAKLAVGYLKRLEVARALATEPRLILLDEVMAGLTPTEINEMMGVIESLPQRGITVLWVEHVLTAIMSVAQRIVVLHQGAIIAEGTPSEVAHDPDVVKAYLGESYVHAARK